MSLIIYVDGGARGNPGPAGAGVVIRTQHGQLVHEGGYFLGRQTNNAAEYHAVVRALQRAQQCDDQPIALFSDSELLVRQLTGQYQVKSARLATLFHQVQMLLLKVSRWSIRHVPREENRRADELANLAMDQGRDVVVFDADHAEPGTAAQAAPQPPPAPRPEPAPAAPPGRQAVRVTMSQPPQTGACPARGLHAEAVTIESALPAGLCIHAAHAILPTLLAMLNTAPQEFAAVPTLTVRCAHPSCTAVFQLSPVHSANGEPHTQ